MRRFGNKLRQIAANLPLASRRRSLQLSSPKGLPPAASHHPVPPTAIPCCPPPSCASRCLPLPPNHCLPSAAPITSCPPQRSLSSAAASCQLPSLSRSHVCQCCLFSFTLATSGLCRHHPLLWLIVASSNVKCKCHPVVFAVVLIFAITVIVPLLLCRNHHHPVVSLALPLIVVMGRFGARGMVERIGDRQGLNSERRERGQGSDRFIWRSAKNPREILRPQTH